MGEEAGEHLGEHLGGFVEEAGGQLAGARVMIIVMILMRVVDDHCGARVMIIVIVLILMGGL